MIDTVAQGASTTSTFNDGSMVVVAIIAIIMTGVFTYMFITDRKLSKLEKELKD